MYKGLKVQIEMVREGNRKLGPEIKCPEDIYELLSDLDKKDREHLMVICLTAKNRVICINTVSIGSLTASICSPREVFKPAILANSAAIVLAHNHPSGEPKPSEDDIEMTNQIAKAGKILDINVLDHVIIGNGKWFSFKEKSVGGL